MPRYLFTGAYDRVFCDLALDEHTRIERPEPVAGALDPVPGGGVHLQPGDVLVTAGPLPEHIAAHPELVLEEPSDAPAAADVTESAGQDLPPAPARAAVRRPNQRP